MTRKSSMDGAKDGHARKAKMAGDGARSLDERGVEERSIFRASHLSRVRGRAGG